MAHAKEIRNKIKSVQGTRKITKAMEMVAASKMKKAQDRMREMARDGYHSADVRTRSPHPVLRLLHLRRRNHLHRFGDLARALHALDLVADLFRAGHGRR